MLKGKLRLLEKQRDALTEWFGEDCSTSELGFEFEEELKTFPGLKYPRKNEEEEEEVQIDHGLDRISSPFIHKNDEESFCIEVPSEVGHGWLNEEFSQMVDKNEAESRCREFLFEVSQKVIDMERLQRLASFGVPDEGGFRATVWKLLLGYLPLERDSWDIELSKNRSKYAALKEELILNPSELTRRMEETSHFDMQGKENDEYGLLIRHKISHGDHPLSLGKTSVWHRYFQDAEIAEQIDRDLIRTHPDMELFSGNSLCSKQNRGAMRNILLLFAKMNPVIQYVQGMNEVLAPLYYVFRTDLGGQNVLNAEADSFACFVRLLSDSVDHFCQQLDNSSVGIHSTLSRLSELLKTHDEELWRHLEFSTKVNPQFYAFRWITLLLTQEFNFPTILRIWDSLLSNPSGVQFASIRTCC
ncbi:TBC1 domain family member 13 isoform X2 [Amborella trichopoda]|uniref:TBC1 domain family member 13 isoform X2 n=1 Tax=Amborella trichopoda TaxID=13333 RepID=UPI0009BFB455|nr:TBC1 domain family member 13 isoform X2 [Amborella trichopoda]|eukprot:XP_020521479.1 TBC1 domain family member 13 isoform X2 [Amborella trichopoda]